MKNIIAVSLLAVSALSGCASTTSAPVKKMLNESAVCNFDKIDGDIYFAKGFNTNFFYMRFNLEDVYAPRKEKDAYISTVLESGFKYSGKVETCADCSKYPLEERVIRQVDGELYVLDRAKVRMAEIINEQCELAWIRTDYIFPHRDFKRKDDMPLTALDYRNIMGKDNFKKLAMEPVNVEKDKFQKTFTISGLTVKTGGLDGYVDWASYAEGELKLFRVSGNLDTGKLLSDNVQLYAKLAFQDSAQVDRAYDEDSNKYEAVSIDTEAKCSSGNNCHILETVGISIPLSYLKKKREEGFDVQFEGNQKKIINVPSYLIEQILLGIDGYN